MAHSLLKRFFPPIRNHYGKWQTFEYWNWVETKWGILFKDSQYIGFKVFFHYGSEKSRQIFPSIFKPVRKKLQILFWSPSIIAKVPYVEQELRTLPEHPSSPPYFSGVRVAWSLVFCVVFCRSLSFCNYSIDHCIACPTIHGFWLVLWYLQTYLCKCRFELSLAFRREDWIVNIINRWMANNITMNDVWFG